MEALTRLVTESLVRHGFDRPLDYRRLHWSRWFRCESHHSLLLVPSKPGVFALAEEIVELGANETEVRTDAFGYAAEQGSAGFGWDSVSNPLRPSPAWQDPAGALASAPRRMLAVTQFFEDDDMAFVLDRMLAYPNRMRARLNSGRYFVRFVVIEDASQRRSICSALNQWIVNTSEMVSGIGAHFATSLELTPATEYLPHKDDAQASLFGDSSVAPTSPEPGSMAPSPATAEAKGATSHATATNLDSGAAANLHCPCPFPSGF